MPGFGIGMLNGLFSVGEQEGLAILEAVVRQAHLPLLRDRVGDRIVEVTPSGTRWLDFEEAEAILTCQRFWLQAASYEDCFALCDEETELALPNPDPATLKAGSYPVPKGRLELPGRDRVFVDAAHLRKHCAENGQERALSLLDSALEHHLPFHVYMEG